MCATVDGVNGVSLVVQGAEQRLDRVQREVDSAVCKRLTNLRRCRRRIDDTAAVVTQAWGERPGMRARWRDESAGGSPGGVEGGMLALQNRGEQATVHARIHARRTVGRVLPTIPVCQRQAR